MKIHPILKNNKLSLSLIFFILILLYSVFRVSNDINENVSYNVNMNNSEYQVIHSSKIFGTNFAILGQFVYDTITKKKTSFYKIANFSGPVNIGIRNVKYESSGNHKGLNFELVVLNPFSRKKEPIECGNDFNYEQGNYNNHLKYYVFGFEKPIKDESDFKKQRIEKNLNAFCCGRMCNFNVLSKN